MGNETYISKDNRGHSEERRFLILLHLLNEYKEHFGQQKYLELIDRCGTIKNEQREKDEYNELQFMLKLLGIKMAEEERIQKEMALDELWRCLDEKMKQALAKEQWERNWDLYFLELAEQMWAQLNAIQQENLRKQYLELITNLDKVLTEHVDCLKKVRDFLSEWIDIELEIISIKEEEEINRIRNIINSLPELDFSYEERKQFILLQVNEFEQSKERDIRVLVNKISPKIEALNQHIESKYNLEISQRLASEWYEKILPGLIECNFEKIKIIPKNDQLGKIDKLTQELPNIVKDIKNERRNPSYELSQLTDYIKQVESAKECSKNSANLIEELDKGKIVDKNVGQYSEGSQKRIAELRAKSRSAINKMKALNAFMKKSDNGASESEKEKAKEEDDNQRRIRP